MNTLDIQPLLRLLIFGLLAYFFFLITQPFIPTFILAVGFAIVFYPVFQFFERKLKQGPTMAALLTVVLTFLFIILPLGTLLGLITNEAVIFAQNTDFKALAQSLNTLTHWSIFGYELDLVALKEKLIGALGSLGSYASSKSFSILSAISNSLFLFFVFLLLYYYLLRDGERLKSDFKNLLPFEKNQQNILFQSFREIAKTVFYGNFLSALAAGVVAYLGFLLFGFKGALIWGLLAAIFSFIPTLGTLLVYLAGILILGVGSGWILALLMFAYFIGVEIILRENILRGKLLEDRLHFHPILVFFALVGGVTAFGSLGLIYGPLIITFLGALYQFELAKKLKR